MRPHDLEAVQSVLRDHQAFIYDRFRITDLLIFGSYARREQTEQSDVDILIRYERAPTLWMIFELREYLSELLGLPVDVVTEKGLNARMRSRVLAEAIKV